MRKVTVNDTGKRIVLPNGAQYVGPATATLTDEEFAKLSPTIFSSGLLTLAADDEVSRLDGLELARGIWGATEVPQLSKVPISLMGHSWTVPAGWHKTNNHWSALFPTLARSETITNQGVGGSTMEFWAAMIDANPAGAYTAYDWGRPATKSLCLMMNVLNSAKDISQGLEFSLDSFRKTARMCAATVVSDRIAATASGSMVYSGTWSTISVAQSIGTISYTTANGAKVTWTAPADKAAAWLVRLALTPGHAAFSAGTSTYRITKNGDTIYETGSEKINALGGGAVDTYGKVAIPLGAITAGDVIVFEKISGPENANNAMWFDGIMTANASHHIAFTKDPVNIDSVANPGYSVESITAHNAVLDEIKAEFDLIDPNMVSVVDLGDIDSWEGQPMLWTGDTVHPNDKGQPWLAAELTKGLADQLPWTTRLHTI